MLAHCGVRCELVEIIDRSRAGRAIYDWAAAYFSPGDGSGSGGGGLSAACNTAWPLYLQHSSHSMTLLGVTMAEGAERLIIRDPVDELDVV